MDKLYVKKGALLKTVTKETVKSYLQDGYKLVDMKDGMVTVKNPVTDELQKLKSEIESLKTENQALKSKLAKKTTPKSQE